MMTHGGPRQSRGITLMELMVTMVVVSILAAIAIPSYQGYTLRAARTDAKRELFSLAQRLERCYTRFNVYDNANCTVTLPVLAPSGATADAATYRINGEIEEQEFQLVAEAINTQARDNKCGDLSINQAGVQGASGTLAAQRCWQGSNN